MKKLEKLGLSRPHRQDAERLERWLFEWNLLKESEAAEAEETGGDARAETRG